MPIHYVLHKNHLTSEPADYAARVRTLDSVDLDLVAEEMIKQGSTTTRSDILAVLEDAILACESLLAKGFRVKFGGLCDLFPRIKGVFNSALDEFDASRHKLDVGANPGTRVRKTIRAKGTVTKNESITPAPNAIAFRDIASETSDGQATPGGIGELSGKRLKFDAGQPDEGVFFVPSGPGTSIKVSEVQKNTSTQVAVSLKWGSRGDRRVARPPAGIPFDQDSQSSRSIRPNPIDVQAQVKLDLNAH